MATGYAYRPRHKRTFNDLPLVIANPKSRAESHFINVRRNGSDKAHLRQHIFTVERYHRVKILQARPQEHVVQLGPLLLGLIEFARGHRRDSGDHVEHAADGLGRQTGKIEVGNCHGLLLDERGDRLRPGGGVKRGLGLGQRR